ARQRKIRQFSLLKVFVRTDLPKRGGNGRQWNKKWSGQKKRQEPACFDHLGLWFDGKSQRLLSLKYVPGLRQLVFGNGRTSHQRDVAARGPFGAEQSDHGRRQRRHFLAANHNAWLIAEDSNIEPVVPSQLVQLANGGFQVHG